MRNEFKNNNWSKRYLPHYNADYKYQMITYRLADSLPQKMAKNPGAPQDSAGKEKSDLEKRKFIEGSLDKGYGSCLLSVPEVAKVTIESWKYFHGIKYELVSYVVMPNHVHTLIRTLESHSLGKIVWGWKTRVSKLVYGRPDLYEKFIKYYSELTEFNGYGTAPMQRKVHLKPAKFCGAPGNIEYYKTYRTAKEVKNKPSIWHREYWDRFIRDENHFNSAINYIHENPVKAGLVNNSSNWKYSSCYEK